MDKAAAKPTPAPQAKMEALRLRAAMWYVLDAITSAIIRIIIGQDYAFMFYDS